MKFAALLRKLHVDGLRSDHDLVIDRGKIQKRDGASIRSLGHTPLSLDEDVLEVRAPGGGDRGASRPWTRSAARRNSGMSGSWTCPRRRRLRSWPEVPTRTNAVLHLTCWEQPGAGGVAVDAASADEADEVVDADRAELEAALGAIAGAPVGGQRDGPALRCLVLGDQASPADQRLAKSFTFSWQGFAARSVCSRMLWQPRRTRPTEPLELPSGAEHELVRDQMVQVAGTRPLVDSSSGGQTSTGSARRRCWTRAVAESRLRDRGQELHVLATFHQVVGKDHAR